MKTQILLLSRIWTFASIAILLSGCAGITAVNIPGLGYFDSDPPPVTPEDKRLMYDAVVGVANQRRVGAFSEWYNPATGHRGTYEVTRAYFRNVPDPYGSPYGANNPAAEISEVIYAGGREFVTHGMAVYQAMDGEWYRYK